MGHPGGRSSTLSSLITFGPGRIEKMCLEAGVTFHLRPVTNSSTSDEENGVVREVEKGLVSEMRSLLREQVKSEIKWEVKRKLREEQKKEVRRDMMSEGRDLGVVMEVLGELSSELRGGG
jgi:hypothetical protein